MSVASLADERDAASEAFTTYKAKEQIYRLALSKDVPGLVALGKDRTRSVRVWCEKFSSAHDSVHALGCESTLEIVHLDLAATDGITGEV
jgi:hypothetical protein